MKKKLFSLLALLMVAVTSAWAEKDIVPSDQVLSDYYNQGDVCVCIYVPADMACNDIVLTGSFNGWSSTPASLPHFEPIEGYDGWYVASFEPEAEPDPEKGVQAKPVMLQDDGNFNWDYQVGAATAIRGGVQVEQGASAGEINLINYGNDAPNVFTVDAWKMNPCTAIYHNYKFTVVSDGCDGFAVPFLAGSMTNWNFQQMQLDAEKTQENQAPTYFINIKAAEGAPYQILSGLKNEGGEITVQPAWTDDAYMQKLVNNEWVRIPGDDGDNQLTKEDPNIVWDLRAEDLRWARSASPAPAVGDDFTLSVGTNDHGSVKFLIGQEEVTTAKEGQTVTVVIEPNTGWSVGGLQGLWYAAGSATKAPKRAAENVDLMKDFELEPVTGQENAWSFEMKRANAEISVSYRKLLTHTDISFVDIAAVTYTGQALTPAVTVKDGTTTLTKDTHYTVSYEDNVDAGTAKVTIIGKGDYDGQVVKNFTINKANITPTAPTALENLTYNTQAQTLISAGQAEGGEMQYSLDNQTYATTLPQGTNAGSYTVFYKVVGDKNHNDVAPAFINVAIYKAALSNVLIEQTNLVYNQQEQSPVITSVKAGELIVPTEAYTISGNKATNVGNYEVVIEPKDDAQNYDGRATAQWSIIAADAQTFTINLASTEMVFNGTELKPTVTVKDGETTLVEGTDYTVTYANNVNVGTATVTATGIGNYTGTQTKEFSITKADMTITAPAAISGLVYTTQPQALANAGSVEGGELFYSLDNQTWAKTVPTGTDAKEYTVYYKIEADANHKAVDPQNFKVTIDQATLTTTSLAETNFIYNKLEREAQVVYVNAGTIVVPAASYEVSGNKATNVGNYTAKVTGKGNFKGEVTTQWSIVAANAQLFDLTLGTTEYTYDGNAKTPTVTVKDGEATLVEGTDYTLTYTANTNAGTATVTATGKGNYTGTQTATFTIIPATLTSVTLAQTEFQFNLFDPVEQTAAISEVKAGSLTVPAAQYDVEGNTKTKPGLYTVTVTGKTNFQGTVTADFVIKDQMVPGEGEKTESGEGISGIIMKVSVVNRPQQTLSIDEITMSTSSSEEITIDIPATVNGWSVVTIAPDAMANLDNVSDINMPDTEKAIMIGANAFPGLATIHTTLALLDDYALMAGLKPNYEATKVLTTVTPKNKYWTLGTGCDVIIPDGIDVYTVQVKNTAEVATEIVPEDQLKYGNERIIKANNGVLLLGTAGQIYDLVAYSGRIASGMPVATSDNKDYGSKNCLEPVIEKKHYDSGHYFVLQNNEFHAILAEGDDVKVPAGKAVLHLGDEQAGAKAMVLQIAEGDATGVKEVIEVKEVKEVNDDRFYDLSGRHVAKPTKGIYVKNGRKVVIK